MSFIACVCVCVCVSRVNTFSISVCAFMYLPPFFWNKTPFAPNFVSETSKWKSLSYSGTAKPQMLAGCHRQPRCVLLTPSTNTLCWCMPLYVWFCILCSIYHVHVWCCLSIFSNSTLAYLSACLPPPFVVVWTLCQFSTSRQSFVSLDSLTQFDSPH